jgi:hypothetical protein
LPAETAGAKPADYSVASFDGKAFATTTFFSDVGVSELKRSVQSGAGEIDFGPIQKGQAVGRYHDSHSLVFEHDIFIIDRFGEIYDVSPSGTSGAPDSDSKPLASIRSQETLDPFCRAICQSYRHSVHSISKFKPTKKPGVSVTIRVHYYLGSASRRSTK